MSKTPAQDLAARRRLEPHCTAVDVLAADGHSGRGAKTSGVPLLDRHRCAQAAARVRELLAHEGFDLVHAEGFYLMQHVPAPAPVPTLLVEQNVEYELERQRAAVRPAPVTDLDAFSTYLRTRSAEMACWRRASHIGALTSEDRETILAARPGPPVTLLPDGADHLPLAHPGPHGAAGNSSGHGGQESNLLFVANFAYSPNVDAAIHFTQEVLPHVLEAAPPTRLWLVGNAPPREVRQLACEHVEVTGPVADVTRYLDAADVVVCPLRIGGGIKVKTVEALRRGKAMVSTSIGVQGLPPQARAAVRVADAPSAFGQAVLALLRDRAARRSLERRAAAAAKLLPSWDEAADAVAELYLDLVEARAQLTAPQSVTGARAGGRA